MSKNSSKEKKVKTPFGKRVLKTLLIAFLLVVAVVVLYLSTLIISASFENIDIDSYVLNQSSQIFFEDKETGNYVSIEKVYSNENRVWVSYLDMPQHLKDAAVAIEDERFFHHSGVDLKRSIGATITYMFNRESGYGGSTITQQVIKNMTGHDERSISRKVKEMWNSFRLERKMSKEQILELYLNTIYLSQGCNGVGAAANMYFDKDVSELTIAEAAAIVGITQYPTKYDPFLNPESNKEKQETVLYKMHDLGFISDDEYHSALSENLDFAKENFNQGLNFNSYFIDQVIMDVAQELADKKSYDYDAAFKLLHTGGFKIYSTLDPDIQSAIDAVYTDTANFPEGSQSAMVVMDPYTGEVKGISGGVGKKTGDFVLNRATMAKRAPGSSFKPLAVYAPALEFNIISPYSTYYDKKITRNGWTPTNAYSGYKGAMSVAAAVKISTNTVAVQVLEDLGLDRSFDFVTEKLGFTTLVDSRTVDGFVYSDKTLASLALGGLTDGVTVYEMAAAYSAFPNEGVYIKPHTFTKVVDKNGKVVLEANAKETIAMSKKTALQMTQLLLGVTAPGGTGSLASVSGMPVAGKTGTTDHVYDKWFVGYTPYYVGAVWFGYDISQRIPGNAVNTAVTTWNGVMRKIHEDLPSKKFPNVTMYNPTVPRKTNNESNNTNNTDGMVSVCTVSGKRSSAVCSNAGTVTMRRLTSGMNDFCSSEYHSGISDTTENVPDQSSNIQPSETPSQDSPVSSEPPVGDERENFSPTPAEPTPAPSESTPPPSQEPTPVTPPAVTESSQSEPSTTTAE